MYKVWLAGTVKMEPGKSPWRLLEMMKKIVVVFSIFLFALGLGMIVRAQAPAKVAGTWVMTNQGRNGVVTNTLTLT